MSKSPSRLGPTQSRLDRVTNPRKIGEPFSLAGETSNAIGNCVGTSTRARTCQPVNPDHAVWFLGTRVVNPAPRGFLVPCSFVVRITVSRNSGRVDGQDLAEVRPQLVGGFHQVDERIVHNPRVGRQFAEHTGNGGTVRNPHSCGPAANCPQGGGVSQFAHDAPATLDVKDARHGESPDYGDPWTTRPSSTNGETMSKTGAEQDLAGQVIDQRQHPAQMSQVRIKLRQDRLDQLLAQRLHPGPRRRNRNTQTGPGHPDRNREPRPRRHRLRRLQPLGARPGERHLLRIRRAKVSHLDRNATNKAGEHSPALFNHSRPPKGGVAPAVGCALAKRRPY